MTPTVFSVRMDDQDFDQLADDTMQWASTDWRAQDGRFLARKGEYVNYDLKMAYWFERYGDMMYARGFLNARLQPWQYVYDQAADTCVNHGGHDQPHVLLTDYVSLSWRTHENCTPEQCRHDD